MPVPSTITDLSDSAASNFPQDSDSTGSTVASLPRAIQAIVKKQFIRGSDVAVSSSGVVTLNAEYSYFVVTGSGYNITGFSDAYNGRKVTLKFSGALTLVHSASLVLPSAANITTAAGDVFEFVNESSGVWRCTFNYSFVSAGLALKANIADLANNSSASKGSSLVGFLQNGTGAVGRTAQSKLRDMISILDFGADPTGTIDSAPAVRLAMASVAYGGTIYVPAGIYLMNSATNNAVLDFTSFPNKPINFQGEGWTLKTGGSWLFGTGTGPRGSVFKMGGAISSLTDFYYQRPTDLVVGGMSFKDIAIVASTGAYGTAVGQNGFNFDGGGNGYFENIIIDNVFIDNFASGGSILINGIGNTYGLVAGANIRNSKFMSFYGPNLGDSVTIEKNTIGANAGSSGAVGINWYNASGATNTRILNNNLVNFNGMILCNGGTKPIIDGNELEQSDVTNSLGALISLAGSIGLVDTPTVTNNSVAQNSSVANYIPIYVANCSGALISNNRISTIASYPHVTLNSNCSYAVVEADNQSWINGVVQNGVSVSNSGSRNMVRCDEWKTYTPTITSATGVFTTVSGSGRYQIIGTRTLAIELDITITSAGTAGGDVYATLPNSTSALVAAAYQTFSGREVAVIGVGLAASISSGSSTISILQYDGTTVIASGRRLIVSGIIEIQ